jgi:hypothetical protein
VATFTVPSLPARTAGTKLTAAIYKADITDGLGYLLNVPHFVGTQAVTQSIGNATWVALTLDTEQSDPYAGHSTSSNTSRWTCPAGYAGWYTACGVYVAVQNSTGNRGARLQVNGAPVSGAATFGLATGSPNSPGVTTPTRDIFLNAGDYLEVAAWQNITGGGSLSTAVFSDVSSALWLRYSRAA